MINKRSKDFDILIEPYNNEYFKVDFPGQFNNQMLEAVKNIHGRRWNKTHHFYFYQLFLNLYLPCLFPKLNLRKNAMTLFLFLFGKKAGQWPVAITIF